MNPKCNPVGGEPLTDTSNSHNIAMAVVEDLLVLGLVGLADQKVVLVMASAGGSRAASNGDLVSARLASLGSAAHISCVLGGADLEPV